MLIPLTGRSSLSPAHQRRLAAFTNLKDVQLRQKWELEEGVYLAESQNVIERAVKSGHYPEAFFLSPTWLEKLTPILVAVTGQEDGAEIPIFVVEEAETVEITGYRLHRGALGLFRRPPQRSATDLLASLDGSRPRCVAVLEGLVDHTNVGAIFRSAAALGVDAVLLSPTCADPLYRRSIRVSMGAVFQVPWGRLEPWPSWDLFSAKGYLTCALTRNADATNIETFIAELAADTGTAREGETFGSDPDLALFLGSEGPGLSSQLLAGADKQLRIPLADAVDSLNVATAAAIAFWEARRYTGAT